MKLPVVFLMCSLLAVGQIDADLLVQLTPVASTQTPDFESPRFIEVLLVVDNDVYEKLDENITLVNQKCTEIVEEVDKVGEIWFQIEGF
jgi:hypothetical protein